MTLIALLQQQPWFFIALTAFFGSAVGSFLNVVIHRLPRMLEIQWKQECREFLGVPAEENVEQPSYNLLFPSSHCPNCNIKIHPLHNIPLFSYLWLRGRCAHCHAPIAWRYPLVELASGILSALVAWHYGFGEPALYALLFTWALLCLTLIDLEHQLLPDIIVLPLLWLGLLISLRDVFVDSHAAIIGAAAGYLALWSIYHAFRLATGKEGMGHGDFKLLATLGAWAGWKTLPMVILLSSLVGAVIGIGLIIFAGRGRNAPMPFGPFLAAAGWIALLWGQSLIELYP